MRVSEQLVQDYLKPKYADLYADGCRAVTVDKNGLVFGWRTILPDLPGTESWATEQVLHPDNVKFIGTLDVFPVSNWKQQFYKLVEV